MYRMKQPANAMYASCSVFTFNSVILFISLHNNSPLKYMCIELPAHPNANIAKGDGHIFWIVSYYAFCFPRALSTSYALILFDFGSIEPKNACVFARIFFLAFVTLSRCFFYLRCHYHIDEWQVRDFRSIDRSQLLIENCSQQSAPYTYNKS